MNVETEAGLYMTCDGMAEIEEGKTAEVLLEMKGGMGRKRNKEEKNPRNSSESSSGVSEPERVNAEAESSSAEESVGEDSRDDGKKATQALEEGGVFGSVGERVGADDRE